MARLHGKDARIYLGSRDVSADLTTINISAMADVEDSTTFSNNSAHAFDPGLYGWEAELTGFYDGAASGIGRQFETLLGAVGGIISVYEGPTLALFSKGILLSDGVLAKRGQPIEVASLTKLTGSFKPTSNAARPGMFGALLHLLAIESSSSAQLPWLDNGATSPNGGRINVHVTAATGSGGSVFLVSSPDNGVTPTTIATLPVIATPGAQSVEVTGTIDRYLRVGWTVPGASSFTFLAGFARY